jgi:phosphate-selective porin OprO and OprP
MNFNKKLAVAVSGAVLLMAGQVALADSATDIVDALVSKGVLTEEEGKLITKGHTHQRQR